MVNLPYPPRGISYNSHFYLIFRKYTLSLMGGMISRANLLYPPRGEEYFREGNQISRRESRFCRWKSKSHPCGNAQITGTCRSGSNRRQISCKVYFYRLRYTSNWKLFLGQRLRLGLTGSGRSRLSSLEREAETWIRERRS